VRSVGSEIDFDLQFEFFMMIQIMYKFQNLDYIYLTDVENFLHGHPNIEDGYVVGQPDKRMSEELYTCLKLCRGHTMTGELRACCKNKILIFKILILRF